MFNVMDADVDNSFFLKWIISEIVFLMWAWIMTGLLVGISDKVNNGGSSVPVNVDLCFRLDYLKHFDGLSA